jgi:hypothetical protein
VVNARQRLNAQLAKMEPQLRAAFIAAIHDITSTAQIAVIARAIEEGRVDDAVRAIGLQPAFFAPLDDALRAAYLLGGRDAIAALPVIPDPAGLGKR